MKIYKYSFIIILFCSSYSFANSFIPAFYNKVISHKFYEDNSKIVIHLSSDVREYDYLILNKEKNCNIESLKLNNELYLSNEKNKFDADIFQLIKSNSNNRYFNELNRFNNKIHIYDNLDSFKIIGKLKPGLYRIKFLSDGNLPVEIKSINIFGNFFSRSYQVKGIEKLSTDYYQFMVNYESSKIVLFKNKDIEINFPVHIELSYDSNTLNRFTKLNSHQILIPLRPIFTNKFTNNILIDSIDINCIKSVQTRTTKADWYESTIYFSQWYLKPIQPLRFEGQDLYLPILRENINYELFENYKKLKLKEILIFSPSNILKQNVDDLINDNFHIKLVDKKKYSHIVIIIANAHRSAINTIFINAKCDSGIRDVELNNFFNGFYYTNLDNCLINYIKFVPRVSKNIIKRVGQVKKNFSIVLSGEFKRNNLEKFENDYYQLLIENDINKNDFSIYAPPK